MPSQVTKIRVFVASPGDVQAERDILAAVVVEINLTLGNLFGFVVELVRWETHVVPGIGRPQALINEQIGDYDVFVGIMWKRFGTPTGEAGSGTEEEFRLAYQAWEADQGRPVLFYFSEARFEPTTAEEHEQGERVAAVSDRPYMYHR